MASMAQHSQNIMFHRKSVFSSASLVILCALAAIPSTSCSHTPGAQSQIGDTIHLVTNTPVVAFYSDSTADSIPIWLSCGCRFRLNTLESGGDVSAFRVTSRTPDTTWIVPHYLRFRKVPSAGTTLRAWYAFSAQDHYGQMDYDTIRVAYHH